MFAAYSAAIRVREWLQLLAFRNFHGKVDFVIIARVSRQGWRGDQAVEEKERHVFM